VQEPRQSLGVADEVSDDVGSCPAGQAARSGQGLLGQQSNVMNQLVGRRAHEAEIVLRIGGHTLNLPMHRRLWKACVGAGVGVDFEHVFE
jgi:hypothetical protein